VGLAVVVGIITVKAFDKPIFQYPADSPFAVGGCRGPIASRFGMPEFLCAWARGDYALFFTTQYLLFVFSHDAVWRAPAALAPSSISTPYADMVLRLPAETPRLIILMLSFDQFTMGDSRRLTLLTRDRAVSGEGWLRYYFAFANDLPTALLHVFLRLG